MSASNSMTLEEAIREAGEGWLLDSFAPPENASEHLRRTLGSVQEEARRRLGGNAPDLSPEALTKEYGRRPRQVRAFFQALGGTRTPQMLLMAWRILQGMEVKNVELRYERRRSFEVRVVLESQYGESDAPYESSNINDFALLRHLGIQQAGGPVFQGFYAMKSRSS